MDGRDAELLIPDYVAGRLDDETRREVADAIDRSPDLARYRDRVERFYRLDVDIAVERRPAARSGGRLRRAAAAAIVLVFGTALAWTATRSDTPTPAPSAPPITLEVELPEIPADDGAGRWARDVHEARLVSEYTGKPMLAVYSFGPCPRCAAMEPVLDSDAMRELLSGFACHREIFTREIPLPLVMRQAEVRASIVLHMPAVIITADGVDFDTLYDVDELADVERHVARFTAHRKHPAALLEGAAFHEARDLVLGAPARLRAGAWRDVLADLDRVEELARPAGSRFGDLARELRRRIRAAVGEAADATAVRPR